MMDQKYEQALFYIKQMETESARMDYAVMLATALVRKEVCMKKVDDTSEPGLIDRAVRIFDSLDKQNLKESVLKDPENFLNLYSQYPADEIKDELITN